MSITVVGAGLAGCEAAWAIARAGIPVTLLEMKPHKFTPAHKSERFAELVCSNSLKAARLDSAAGMLKEEMRRLGSLCMEVAATCAVPAGGALAVDRDAFAADDAWYDDNREVQQAMLEYALNALEPLAPGSSEWDWQFRSESKAGENRFLHFSQESADGSIPVGVRVQVNPQVTISYYIDHRFFGSEDADRLEPGNG